MHVAVLGAGYAGITLASRLESSLPAGVDLTVVDEGGTHLVQHLVHRVIRDPTLADELRIPLDELLEEAVIRQARVESVAPETGRVSLTGGETLDYDVGAVCLGARTDFHGLPGVPEHGQPLKRVAHAEAIRERFLAVCEGGEPERSGPGTDADGTPGTDPSPPPSSDSCRVVVGGAGTSGVQVAGELAALADERDLAVDLRLLEERETVVPSFPREFRRAVVDELQERDVRVSTNARVASADSEAVELVDGERVPYDQFVWTGGITGQAAMDDERMPVPATLRLADRTFALGDAARVVDADGTGAPATAQTAIRQARVAATNVTRLVDHDLAADGGFEPRLARYRHDPLGWLVSVGDGAVAQVGPTVLRGAPARAIKSTVGLGYLGSRGRVGTAVQYLREHLPGTA
jgi:NADH dehydrogenase